jgi:hypothetical protein
MVRLRTACMPDRTACGQACTRSAKMRYDFVIVNRERGTSVNSLLTLVLWCVLFVLCWPLALLALVLWPVVWIVSLPFRLIGITVDAVFALLRAVLLLPARLLGYRAPRR